MDAKEKIRGKIADLVKSGLKKIGKSRFAFNPEDIQQDGDWWYVPVWPEQNIDRIYEVFGDMAEVESDIQENHDLNVLLVPTQPPKEANLDRGKK